VPVVEIREAPERESGVFTVPGYETHFILQESEEGPATWKGLPRTVPEGLCGFRGFRSEPSDESTATGDQRTRALASTWAGKPPERTETPGERLRMPESAIQELVGERNALLRRKLKASLSVPEQRRLDLIHWKLERIEEEELGQDMDDLGRIVERYEQFARQVEHWVQQVKSVVPAPSKHRGARR
jgi:hypothetical protein